MRGLLVIPIWGWLFISAVFFAGGEYLSKRWAVNPSVHFALFVALVYSGVSLTWLPILLHKNELVRMGMLWGLFTTVATILVGIVIFEEKLTVSQWSGVGLATVAMILLGSE